MYFIFLCSLFEIKIFKKLWMKYDNISIYIQLKNRYILKNVLSKNQ